MTDEAYPPSDLENEHVLDRIKNNDPKITYMEFYFAYGSYSSRNCYAKSVDWDKEQWSFFRNSHLTSVSIDIYIRENDDRLYTPMPEDIDNVRSFARALARNQSITHIRLEGSTSIVGDIFTNLSPMIGRLHDLELVNTDLDNNSVQKLKMALEACGQSELQEFYLACNHTTNEQAGIIIDAINGHCNKLKKLEWGSDNGEGLFEGSNGFLALTNLVSNPSSALEMLDFSQDDHYIDLDDSMAGEIDGTLAFATAIANNSTLKAVNFGGCDNFFTTSEWQIVSSILRHNSIEELCFREQLIGVEGMIGITQGLTNNTSLKKLNLTECGGVTSDGWIQLSDAIENNPAIPLEGLQISASIMTSEVTTSIASILIGNESLKELTLGGRWDMRDEVLFDLSNALAGNDTLTTLSLGHVNGVVESRIKDDQSVGLKVLSRVLCNSSSIDATFQSNHTLAHVSLRVHDDNYRSAVLPTQLADMLRLNGNDNKFEVSRQKILRCHFDGYDTQEFVDMDLEVLPHVLAWSCGLDQRGASLLFRIIQTFPSLFDSNSRTSKAAVVTKRKRNE